MTTRYRTRARLEVDEPRKQESPARSGPSRQPPPRSQKEVRRAPRSWTIALTAAWITFLAEVTLTEPPPDPGASDPLWTVLVAFAFLVALLVALVGFVRRRRWAFRFSALAAGCGIVVAIGCAATHHHAGAWPYWQTGGFVGLAGLSAAAIGKDRAP